MLYLRGIIFRVCLVVLGALFLNGPAAFAATGDQYEPDNSVATAKPIQFGVTQVHSLSTRGGPDSVPPADIDFVTFSLSAASDVIIQTDTDTGAADTILRAYNSSGGQFAMDDDGNPAGNKTSRLELHSLAAGAYCASVESYGYAFGAAVRIKAYRLTAVVGPPGAPFAPIFTSKLSVNASVGAAFGYAISTLASLPVTYTVSGLPPGMSQAGTNIIGVPTQAGTYSATLTATNGTASDATATLVITVAQGGVIATAAGDGKLSFGPDSVQAVASSLNFPVGVATSSGNFYIADTMNNRVRRVDGATGYISTAVGNGAAAFSGDNGPAPASALNAPAGVAFDAANNLYIADSGNNCVRLASAASGVITTIAGTTAASFSGDNGPATAAALNSPLALALDSSGNVYIADTANHRVRKITVASGLISTIAGDGTAGFSGDGGAATAASLKAPAGVAVDAAGNVFISDTKNHRVRRVDGGSGVISTVAGTGVADYSGDGGPASSAGLDTPRGLLVDSSGIYIADSNNDRVRRVDLASGAINTFAGDGVSAFAGDGGLATLASLAGPMGVAEDAAGNVFIADSENSRIRKVGVATPPSITSPATASGTMGQVFSPYLVTASGLPPPRITAANLPPGLSMSSGVISGVPEVSGAVDVTLTAQNSVGSSQLVLRILLALPAGSASTPPLFSGALPVLITATPDPAVAGATVNFVAPAATDKDADLLAYTWDFGDPNAPATASGALAAHAYGTPGIYTVSVTVTDGLNNIVASMPLAVNDPSVTQQMIVSKAQFKLNFLKANSDTLIVSGTIPLRNGFSPGGKTASFYFGSLSRAFTLNDKGKVTSKTDILKLTAKQKPGVFIDPAKQFFSGTFSVTLTKQTLQTVLAPLGFVKNVSTPVPIVVPVLVSISADSYLQNITFVYSSSSKSGSGVKIASGSSLTQRSRK